MLNERLCVQFVTEAKDPIQVSDLLFGRGPEQKLPDWWGKQSIPPSAGARQDHTHEQEEAGRSRTGVRGWSEALEARAHGWKFCLPPSKWRLMMLFMCVSHSLL